MPVEGGEVTTTDGPFAGTKEQLGGFWVIDAPDLDAALALAAKGAAACRGLTDDRLRLIFTCCQPALAPGAQVALTLRLLAAWRP